MSRNMEFGAAFRAAAPETEENARLTPETGRRGLSRLHGWGGPAREATIPGVAKFVRAVDSLDWSAVRLQAVRALLRALEEPGNREPAVSRGCECVTFPLSTRIPRGLICGASAPMSRESRPANEVRRTEAIAIRWRAEEKVCEFVWQLADASRENRPPRPPRPPPGCGGHGSPRRRPAAAPR